MKIVPVIKSSDLARSIDFYTRILDFERRWPGYEEQETANGIAQLVKDGEEIQLSRHAGDSRFGSLTRIYVDNVENVTQPFARAGWTRPNGPSRPCTPRRLTRPGDCANSPSPTRTATACSSVRR